MLCQCEQCGHQDDITSFLQDNNVLCPQCSLRKFHSVDVQTQFRSTEEAIEDSSVIENSSKNNSIRINSTLDVSSNEPAAPPLQSRTGSSQSEMEYVSKFSAIPNSCNRGNFQINHSNIGENYPTINDGNSSKFPTASSVNTAGDFSSSGGEFRASSMDFLTSTSESTSEQFSEMPVNNFNTGNFSTSNSTRNSRNFSNSNTVNNSSMGQFSVQCSMDNAENSPYTCDEKKSSDNSAGKLSSKNEDLKNLSNQSDTFNFPSGKKPRKPSEKLHTCDVCSRVFNHKGHLKRHMLVHDKSIRHFLCEECGMSFNQKSSLVTHWTSRHCKGKLSWSCCRSVAHVEGSWSLEQVD